MVGLTALSSLRIAPDALGEAMRDVLDPPLRREGTLAKLCVTGIVSCAGRGNQLPDRGRTALIWGSPSGARIEVEKVLDQICRHDSLPMPFDFIASQCGVAAVYAARYVPSIACGMYLPSDGNLWQQMLCLATCWLEQGRYDHVLCGWVDQATPDAAGQRHVSDWVRLSGTQNIAPFLARVALSTTGALHSREIADAEFIPVLQRWLDDKSLGMTAPLAVPSVVFHRA